MNLTKTRKITLSGFYIAISVILVYISSVIPNSKVFLLVCASAVIPMAVITVKKFYAFLIYIGTCMILFVVMPLKGIFISYALFFGIYGLIKSLIESIRKLPLEILLKLLFFNACIVSISFIFKMLLGSFPKINIPYVYAVLMLQFIFLIYDYALTIFVSYINKKIKIFL